MRDEVREGLFAGFGEMDFLSSPQGRALFASMGFWIVRRVDEQRGRRKIFTFSPPELLILNEIVLDPDPTEDLDGRHLPQPGRRHSASNTAVNSF